MRLSSILEDLHLMRECLFFSENTKSKTSTQGDGLP